MSKNIFTKSLLITAILFLASCDKDDEPEVVHEHEEFTRVTLDVTNQSDNTTTQYVFEIDEHDDHNHGSNFTNSSGLRVMSGEDHMEVELEPNSTYLFDLHFYNDEDPNNIEDLTEEVIEEADEHQVFYAFADINTLTYESAPGDTLDSSSNPVMLKTLWTTTTESSGEVFIHLIHEPTSKVGTVRNDFGGADDLMLEFEAHVEND